MIRLDVERLQFNFGACWRAALKWDDSDSPYRNGIEKLKGTLDGREESTKAVDVVAVHEARLCLVEVKDFRPRVGEAGIEPNAAAFAGRWQTLPLEIALKVRDTLAGLIGVVSYDTPSELASG